MYKVLSFIKRKDGVTHAEFRDHFERSHAAMALRYCGHLFSEYRRNYITTVYAGGDPRDPDGGFGPREWDLISEWITPNKEAYDEIIQIMEEPGKKEKFWADEDRFFDRRSMVMVPCDVADVGTLFNPKGTVFDTPSGEPSWADMPLELRRQRGG
jgi:hypothetical protein